jgi:hypothetical protein
VDLNDLTPNQMLDAWRYNQPDSKPKQGATFAS